MVILNRPAHVSFMVGILRCRGGKIYQWTRGNLFQKLKINPDHPVPKLDSWVLLPFVIITALTLVLPRFHVVNKRFGNKLGKKFSSIQFADFLEVSLKSEAAAQKSF